MPAGESEISAHDGEDKDTSPTVKVMPGAGSIHPEPDVGIHGCLGSCSAAFVLVAAGGCFDLPRASDVSAVPLDRVGAISLIVRQTNGSRHARILVEAFDM